MFQLAQFASILLLTLVAAAPATRPAEADSLMVDVPTTSPTTQPEPEQVRGPKELITIQNGELPIILSAPHGGSLVVPHSTKRTGTRVTRKRGGKNIFVITQDKGVDRVTLATADEIERLTGKRPYVVVANFARTYVDANRPPEEAYESDAGEAVYERYHDAIRRFRREIIDTWGRGLLLDIHGHGGDREALIRGTANWMSVRHLVVEFGKGSVTGEDGLFAPLAAAGVKIVPPNDRNDELEVPALNGGFITRSYGSFQGGIFDAIQLELGAKLRSGADALTFSKQLAEAIVPFMDRYLLVGPPAETQPATRSTTEAATQPAVLPTAAPAGP